MVERAVGMVPIEIEYGAQGPIKLSIDLRGLMLVGRSATDADDVDVVEPEIPRDELNGGSELERSIISAADEAAYYERKLSEIFYGLDD